MKTERYSELMTGDEIPLTPDEMAAGWHWCPEFDDMMLGPGMSEIHVCMCHTPQIDRARKATPEPDLENPVWTLPATEPPF